MLCLSGVAKATGLHALLIEDGEEQTGPEQRGEKAKGNQAAVAFVQNSSKGF